MKNFYLCFLEWGRRTNFVNAFVISGCLLFTLANVGTARGQIVTSGNLSHLYDGSNPWDLGTDVLIVGETSNGSLEITGDNRVLSNGGILGADASVTGTVTISDTGNWESAGDLTVGLSGAGDLFVSNAGSLVTENAYIAQNSGSTGSVFIDNGLWQVNGSLFVGGDENSKGGIGHVDVLFGSVNIQDSMTIWQGSSVNVEPGATLAAGGGGGAGNNLGIGSASVYGSLSGGVMDVGGLNVLDGGDVFANSMFSNGSILVQGSGSQLNTVDFSIQGDLDIRMGGVASLGNGVVENFPGTLSVDGLGSRLEVGELRDIAGGMQIIVSNGGTFESSNVSFEQDISSVAISGNGSTWNTSSFGFIGNFGNVAVSSGGSLDSTTASITGIQTTVNVSGNSSSWTNSSEIFVGSEAILQIQNGGTVVSQSLRLDFDGNLALTGGKLDVATLDLSATAAEDFNMTGGRLVVDTIMGDFQQDGGTLAPGDSPGLTTMTGNYNMIAGLIEFEIGGDMTRGTDYDAIDVTGIAILNGTMDVNLINSFQASSGESFQLVNAAGGILGIALFDFSDAGLRSGLFWDTSSFSSTGTIFVLGSLSAVPEPTSLLMFGLACSCLAVRRRQSV